LKEGRGGMGVCGPMPLSNSSFKNGITIAIDTNENTVESKLKTIFNVASRVYLRTYPSILKKSLMGCKVGNLKRREEIYMERAHLSTSLLSRIFITYL
jgi:hypothetical protein